MDNNLKTNSATKLLLKRLQGLSRDAHKYKLFCPLCSLRMESLIIDTSVDDSVKEETIWWTCQGVKAKTCDFPLAMPPEVFWTTRNKQQIENDVVPLPNFHLLPPKFHHLYPGFFNPALELRKKLYPSLNNRMQSAPLPERLKRKSDVPCFPQRPSKMINRLKTSSEQGNLSKRKKSQGMSMDQCLELLNSHVPYMPDQGSINARVGKQMTQQQKPTTSNTVEWSELRIGNCTDPVTMDSNTQVGEQFIENLPSCSSESSSNASNPVEQTLPDSFNLQSLGDSELDKLVKENLQGLLRNKKLKKKKKKPKNNSTQEITQPATTAVFDNSLPSSYAYEAPDDFGFHDDFSWSLFTG